METWFIGLMCSDLTVFNVLIEKKMIIFHKKSIELKIAKVLTPEPFKRTFPQITSIPENTLLTEFFGVEAK